LYKTTKANNPFLFFLQELQAHITQNLNPVNFETMVI